MRASRPRLARPTASALKSSPEGARVRAAALALGLLPLLLPGTASAQYKCVRPDGKVSFQQAPCAAGDKEQALNLPAGATGPVKTVTARAAPSVPIPPPPASGPASAASAAYEPSPDKRLAARYQKEAAAQARAARLAELENRVKQAQVALSKHQVELDAELRAKAQDTRDPKSSGYDPNEQKAVDRRHDAVITALQRVMDVDRRDLVSAQEALQKAKDEDARSKP